MKRALAGFPGTNTWNRIDTLKYKSYLNSAALNDSINPMGKGLMNKKARTVRTKRLGNNFDVPSSEPAPKPYPCLQPFWNSIMMQLTGTWTLPTRRPVARVGGAKRELSR